MLKILKNKQNEVAEVSKNYEILLAKYNDKCREVNVNGKQEYYAGLRKTVESSIQTEYNALRIKYEELQREHEAVVNKSHEKYQKVCEDLQLAEKSCQDKTKLITKLGNDIKLLKTKDVKSTKKADTAEKECKLKTKITELESVINNLRLEQNIYKDRIKELEAEIQLNINSSKNPKVSFVWLLIGGFIIFCFCFRKIHNQ